MILVDDSAKSCLPAKEMGIEVYQPKSIKETLDILNKLSTYWQYIIKSSIIGNIYT